MDNGIFKFIRFLNESDYKMPTVELNAQKIYDTMYYNMPKSWVSSIIKGKRNSKGEWDISCNDSNFTNKNDYSNIHNLLKIVNTIFVKYIEPCVGSANGFELFVLKDAKFEIKYSYND